MIKIRIDGKEYEVNPGKNLLETCLSLGINVPHFCYHPALGSVGACRLCAVKKFKDENDKKGRLIMSCMEPLAEGLIVSVDDPDARSFRASIIESLMINHPHDCPVCDEGGECHLQDMTVMTGHVYRRYDFHKRTYKNQDLGPFINHEMNRCIQCYRCVRFYRDYAGGKDLNVFASRNQVYFGRMEDGALENVFSGNLDEVCPTGVFTDKTLSKHYTRKWDLTNSPSVCVHCSVGCNIIVSQRYGTMRRVMNRYNGEVNGYFICDRGRFGYEFVHGIKRIQTAAIRTGKNEAPEIAGDDQVFSAFSNSSGKIIGIGSPRATLESNFALMKLAGEENFYHGISEREHRLTKMVTDYFLKSGIHNPSLKEMEKADVILILGEDLTNTAPMMALAVRQAARNIPNSEAEKNKIPLWNDLPVRELGQNESRALFIATPFADALDDAAEKTMRGSYSEIADLGYAVAQNIQGRKSRNKDIQDISDGLADSLKNAKNPLIVSGVNNGDEQMVQAALNLATALRSKGSNVMLAMALTECNSMGLSMLPGRSFEELLGRKVMKPADKLIIIENDLFRRTASEFTDKLFDQCPQVVVIDHLLNNTGEKADILLPASAYPESEGTIVNYEGRAQRYYKAIDNKNQVKETWKWLTEFMNSEISEKVSWKRVDDILESLAEQLPVFAKLRNYSPNADYRVMNTKVPRQTFRYSGRTAMSANIHVSETKPPQDPDSPLAFSMEGQHEDPPSSLVPFYWTPGWNSVQAVYKKYTKDPESSLKGGDPGIQLFQTSAGEDILFKQETKETGIKKGEFLILPLYQIFGSEELSSMSPPVIQKIQEPFILINSDDAEKQKLSEGDLLELEVSGQSIKVKVMTGQGIQQGIAAVSVNLPGMPYLELPGGGEFHKL